MLLWLACAAGGVVVPSTSLETLPVVYMGGNAAPRPQANLAMLAKMRYVVVEKWEGSCWTECLANTSKGAQCEPSCREEDAQVATLRAVKALNPEVAGVFYLMVYLHHPGLPLPRPAPPVRRRRRADPQCRRHAVPPHQRQRDEEHQRLRLQQAGRAAAVARCGQAAGGDGLRGRLLRGHDAGVRRAEQQDGELGAVQEEPRDVL